MKVKKIDFESIKKMSLDDKKRVLPKLSKIANQRLRTLEKAGFTDYAYRYAKQLNPFSKKVRFSESMKKMNANAVNRQLQYLEKFLNAKTSTLSGLKSIQGAQNKFMQNLSKELGFDKNFYDYSDDFWTFLKSEEYKNSLRYLSSEQIFELYFEFEDANYSKEEIFSKFNQFIDGKKSYYELRKEALEL